MGQGQVGAVRALYGTDEGRIKAMKRKLIVKTVWIVIQDRRFQSQVFSSQSAAANARADFEWDGKIRKARLIFHA